MEFAELIEKRYSVRKYREIPVSDDKISLILEAGRIAPTAKNTQPQRIYVVKSEKAKKKLAGVCKCTFNAPVIFVIAYDNDEMCRNLLGDGRAFGETDATIVATYMMLKATDLRLGTCLVGLFKSDEVKEALGITENVTVSLIMPTGYIADDGYPSERHALRKKIDETVKYL